MSAKKVVAFVLVSLGLVTLLRVAMPAVRHWQNERRVDELLRTDSFFSTVVADQPEVRGPLRAALVEAYDSGRAEDALLFAHTVLGPLYPAYLARGSDAAAVGFARSMVANLVALSAQGTDDCYRALFPRVDGPPQRTAREANDRMADAMRQLVASARESVQARPPRPEALTPVYASLRARHGSQLALVQNPEAADVDRRLVCAVFTDLYQEVLRLPEPEAAGALRHLIRARRP